MKQRWNVPILALALCLCLTLCPVLPRAAETPPSLEVAVSDCVRLGTYDGEAAYLYTGGVPAGAETVTFTDLALGADSMIACMIGDAYVTGTDTAPLTAAYAMDPADGDWVLEPAYAGQDFTGYNAYWILDDAYEMYYVVVKRPAAAVTPAPAPDMTVQAGGQTLAYTVVPEGYTYTDWQGAAHTVDLAVVELPYGVEEVSLTYPAPRLTYSYGAAAEWPVSVTDSGFLGGTVADATVGETEKTVAVDTDGNGVLDYLQVQNPYNADWSGGELRYAVTFTRPFTVSVDGADLTGVAFAPGGYSYTDWQGAAKTAGLYTVTIPAGTESVDFRFPAERLAYNYDKTGAYLSGPDYADNGQTGRTAVTLPVDSDVYTLGEKTGDADGVIDYIWVQTPYDSSWNSELLYVVTFKAANAPLGGGGGSASQPDAGGNVKQYGQLMTAIAASYGDTTGDPWVALDLAAYGKPASYDGAATGRTVAENAQLALAYTAMGQDSKAKAAIAAMGTSSLPNIAAFSMLAREAQRSSLTETETNALAADVQTLLKKQQSSGAWGYDDGPDIDTTAIVVAALAAYNGDAAVDDAIDRAVTWLKKQQDSTGAFGENANTTAMVILALSALGEDAHGVVKNDHSAIEGLLSFALEDSTGFGWKDDQTANAMATEQGFRALVAYARYKAQGSGYNLYLDAASSSGVARTPDLSAIHRTVGRGGASVPVAAEEKAEKPAETGYADVPADAWYAEAAVFVTEQKLFEGYPDNTFRGAEPMTRGMFLTVLWRAAGSPEAAAVPEFADCPAGWYQDAIAWGVETGIVTGYSDAAFGPEDGVTRQQAALMLCRYADAGLAKLPEGGQTTTFADQAAIPFPEAVARVQAAGLMQGYGDNTFRPEGRITRAEAATLLLRLLQK